MEQYFYLNGQRMKILKKGYLSDYSDRVIYNAPNNQIFKEKKYISINLNRKIKILASTDLIIF